MIPEKIRVDSLIPGTSVAPLLPPAVTAFERCVPLISVDGATWGFVSDRNIGLLRSSKYLSYTKYEKAKVLMIKGKDPVAALHRLAEELRKAGILPPGHSPSDVAAVFSTSAQKMQISQSLVDLVGAKTSRVVVVGFVGRDRNCRIWVGRRMGTAMDNPTKIQNLITFSAEELSIGREALAEHAHRSIDLQPDLFSKLRSAGIHCSMLRSPRGIRRVSLHAYEMDLTDTAHFFPRATLPVESFELAPVKSVLDWCHAGLVCLEEIPAIVGFCVRHGIITPETDEHFMHVTQALGNDLGCPFVYRK